MVIANFRLYENKQKAEQILKQHHIQPDNEAYVKLKDLIYGKTDKSIKAAPNYLGQFTKWLIKDRTNMETLTEILKLLNKENVKLDRPIDTFETAEDLFDYIQDYEINQNVNKVINDLPPTLKKMVDEKFKNLIKLNVEFTDDIIKFFKKSKKYDPTGKDKLGYNALYNDTAAFINNLKGDYNLDGMKANFKKLGVNVIKGEHPTEAELKKGSNIKIVIESPTILIVEVFDYKASCAIGSKSWCISTSENQWNSYVNNITVQYFLFDFTKSRSDKKHAIGITVSPDMGNSASNYGSKHWSDDKTDGLTDQYIDTLIEENS